MRIKINSIELFVYFCLWILANLFSLYKLYKAQSEILENEVLFHSLRDLQRGWKFIPRLKDVSDIEWGSWKYFIQTSWYYLMVQFLISEIIRRKNVKLLKYWYILSSTIFIVVYMSFRQFLIIVAQPLIFASIIFSGGKKISVWVTSVLLLMSHNSLKYKHFFWYFLDREDLQDEEVYLILFTVAWIELRCISFSIDYIDKNEKLNAIGHKEFNNHSITENFVNLLSYVLYLPVLYTGPVILYEDFEKSFNTINQKLSLKLRKFVWDMIIYLFYTLLLDLSFHFIYFFALQFDMEAVRKLPTIALCGGGLWMGLEFHMKYVISYGTTSAFARLDNIEPPPTPRCVARVHVYSQMWRYFDVGLYKFLVKYIYKPGFVMIPKCLNLSQTTSKLLASLATFVFIFLWHGCVWHIFVWSVLNYLGITLEHIGRLISESELYKEFKNVVLRTEAMETRFIALICAPLLTMSAVSNSYLFAGNEVGDLFFERIAHPSLWNSAVLILSVYCCCHVSMALADVPSRTDVKKICPLQRL